MFDVHGSFQIDKSKFRKVLDQGLINLTCQSPSHLLIKLILQSGICRNIDTRRNNGHSPSDYHQINFPEDFLKRLSLAAD